MNRAAALLAGGILGLAALAGAGAAETPAGAAPLAHSSQTQVQSSVSGEWLTLRIAHAGDQSPIVSRDVVVSVAGRVIPVTSKGDGTYVLAVRQLGTSANPTLDVIVPHDGIREILTGRLSVTAAAAPESKGNGHAQSLWWIINIAIVFAAAMFLSSRQKKKPAE